MTVAPTERIDSALRCVVEVPRSKAPPPLWNQTPGLPVLTVIITEVQRLHVILLGVTGRAESFTHPERYGLKVCRLKPDRPDARAET